MYATESHYDLLLPYKRDGKLIFRFYFLITVVAILKRPSRLFLQLFNEFFINVHETSFFY